MNPPFIQSDVLRTLPAVFAATAPPRRHLIEAFDRAEMPIQVLDGHAGHFVPERAVFLLLEEISRISGVRDFGLFLSTTLDVGDWGIFGSYIFGAPTLERSLRRTQRRMDFHSSHDRLEFVERGDNLILEHHSALSGVIGYAHFAPGAAHALLSIVRPFFNADWRPQWVELDIVRPRNAPHWEDVFGCPVRFGAATIAVVIRRDEAREKRPEACGRLVTRSDFRRLLSHRAPRETHELVEEVVRMSLMDGEVEIDTVARRLGLGPRTLQRRLSVEGIGFRSLVSRVRTRRALELLTETDAPITAIALDLGYSSPAHFARAFRKSAGYAPSAVRQQRGATRPGEPAPSGEGR